MCETSNPTIPAGAMGQIRFPENGNPGSGDVISAGKTRKKRVRTQKPVHKIISFDEFVSKHNQDSGSQD